MEAKLVDPVLNQPTLCHNDYRIYGLGLNPIQCEVDADLGLPEPLLMEYCSEREILRGQKSLRLIGKAGVLGREVGLSKSFYHDCSSCMSSITT
jgi:hypothetical protein